MPSAPHRALPFAGLTLRPAVGVALLTALVGCPPPSGREVTFAPPRDAAHALAQVNRNFERARTALNCAPALVSFRFRDADGREHRFIAQPATVIFQPPRCLYFDIKNSLGGSVARVGSNDERYWIWVQPEVSRMWWGYWDRIDEGAAERLPIPPDRLLDALMLRPLPEHLDDGARPLLITGSGGGRLIFTRQTADGWSYVAREVHLDPQTPYQPVELVDRLADGTIAMRAILGNYAAVEGAEPPVFTPRRYEVYWPASHAEMRLDVERVRYRTKPTPFCEFDPNPGVDQVEALDAPAGQRATGSPRSISGRSDGPS